MRIAAGVVLALLLAGPAQAAAPTDPEAAKQQPQWIMKVPQALDRIAAPLQDTLVLVPDTGLDLDHPDIAPRLFSNPSAVPAPNPDNLASPGTVAPGAPGWDLIGRNRPGDLRPDPDPSDPPLRSGHGTLVSGVLGAAWDNGVGGAGIASNARYIALRTCWDNDQCYQYVQASAINWAADRGARVVSISWLSGALETELRDAILNHPNVLFVTVPSGSGAPYDADPVGPMPCGLDAPNVLCVTPSSPDDSLDCGAFGPATVDLAVPTRNNVTTQNGGGFTGTACDTGYAAPLAAGIATILFGMDPSAGAADVRAAIVDSARKVLAFQGLTATGGIADAEAAVALFQERRGLPVKPPPAPPVGPDSTAPSFSFGVRPRRFRAGGTGVRLSRVASSIAFRSRVSEPARLSIVVQRARRLRSGRIRWVKAGSLVGDIPAGLSRVLFSGRDARGRRLRTGLYRARARATDAAGNRSHLRIARFRLLR